MPNSVRPAYRGDQAHVAQVGRDSRDARIAQRRFADSWATPPHDPATPTAAGFNGWAVLLIALTTALGLVWIQVANQRALNGGGYGRELVFFWAGLAAIFLPVAIRVIARGTGRAERIVLVILLGGALYAVKIQSSPYAFTFIDEYIHLRNTEDILRSHHVFGYNPLLPTAGYYPGLAAVTAGLENLTGLSTFVSGLVIIGVARVIVSACFFLVAERVTGSARSAGVASLVYAANPMFLFWSAAFSYEDLGLPLAFFVIWWLGRTRTLATGLPQIITAVLIVAVTVTHHISGFALSGILGIWFLLELLARKPTRPRRYVGVFAALTGASTSVWFFLVARPAAAYIFSQNVEPALQETKALVASGHAGRQLYGGGFTPPSWYVLAGFAAIGVIMVALPLALYRAWAAFGSGGVSGRRIPVIFAALIAMSFPLTLLPRLTADGGAISARTSEYVFTGIGCTLGLLAIESAASRRGAATKPARIINFVTRGPRGTVLLFCIVTIMFFGGITIGSSYFQLLPPSSHPTGYPWIVQPDMIIASTWARDHLGPDQPFATDDTDALALATYGDENTGQEDAVFPIFFGDSLGGMAARTIKATGVRYILVDWRMTDGIPVNPGDYYFSQWEPGAGEYTKPFPATYLRKFTTYSCSRLIFQSGPIQIFDVSGIENGTCAPRPIGAARKGAPS